MSPNIQEGPKAASISILHFNDVYNVEEQPSEPLAGAPRFKTAFDSFAEQSPLILFSGDIFAPSIMSTFTRGEQMVPVLNILGVHCSVYGNHDFDFGLERLVEMKDRTNFPWLMSNVVDNETNRPLADGNVTHIINWQGWKIGLIGLVECEWLDTLATINSEQVTFTDFVDAGNTLAGELRNQGCELIIALTHMRTPNDIRLAENVDGIDLILGGHDHVYELIQINGKTVLKSGTDFREFSHITVKMSAGKPEFDIEKVEVTGKYEPNPAMKEALAEYESVVSSKMEEVLGHFTVDLDGRFSSIRTSETNLGNFICDVMLASCEADVAVLNSGTLRSDRIHPEGDFSMRDLMTILPMLDPLCVVQVTGKILLEILENGVCQYPKLEGRFLQVSGVEFVFNPAAPPGSRVVAELVKIGDEYLRKEQLYRLCTKAYVRQGKDGFSMLQSCPVLQDDEQCPTISNAVLNHFTAIKTKQRKTSSHRQSLVLISRRHSLIRSEDEAPPVVCSNNRRRLSRQESVKELEEEACKLSPTCQNRIVKATAEEIEEMLEKKLHDRTVRVIEEVDEPSTPTKSVPATR